MTPESIVALLTIFGNALGGAVIYFRLQAQRRKDQQAAADDRQKQIVLTETEIDRKVSDVQVKAQQKIMDMQDWMQKSLDRNRTEMTQILGDNQRLASLLAAAETASEERKKSAIVLERQLGQAINTAMETERSATEHRMRAELYKERAEKDHGHILAIERSLLRLEGAITRLLVNSGIDVHEESPESDVSPPRPTDP